MGVAGISPPHGDSTAKMAVVPTTRMAVLQSINSVLLIPQPREKNL